MLLSFRFVQVEGETNPLKFSQVFHLAATGGSFVITNGEIVADSSLLGLLD